VPNSREAERPEVNVPSVNHGQNLLGEPGECFNVRVRADDPVLNRDRGDVPPVNHDYIPPRGPGEWVRARVIAQDPVFNRERARAPTPMPARPENDENMEPEVPRMRSTSLEPRGRRGWWRCGSATSEKASPAVPMPEGAAGSAYYRDGTCGTGGAGAFLRVSRKLPASTHWCRSGTGYSAAQYRPGTRCVGCI
jgi:hypothetical protein